jgi:hypothetical protein
MLRRRTSAPLLVMAAALALAILAPLPAQARITAVTGQMEQISQPADARIGALEHDTAARAWDESQGHRLSAPLAVDATPAGPAGTIAAGTVVSSHVIHADRVGIYGELSYRGSATFSAPILGVISTDSSLVNSDFLGAPTLFSPAGVLRGPDPATGDHFTIDSSDTVSIAFASAYAEDEIRVLTRAYDFTGFLRPVENAPEVNVANAGSAIPVKFSLGGFEGYDILAPGSPSSAATACSPDAPLADIEVTATSGSDGLHYDASTDTYVYVWKTEKAWKDQCRALTVTLADGTSHTALFRLK